MPFECHKVFQPAPTKKSLLWRYMGLPKFLSLLQTNSLFFSNLEIMSRGDPFEGTLPPSAFCHRTWNTLEDVPINIKNKIPNYLRPEEKDNLILGLQKLKDYAELKIRQSYAYRRSYFINCWHINEHESAAMWEVYSRRSEGIAIVSSEERMQNALEKCALTIYGGCITYGDYSGEDFFIKDDNAFYPILHKRLSFAYENEYRLAYWDTSITHKTIDGFYNWDGVIIAGSGRTSVGRSEAEIENITPISGVKVDCDLNELISEIYVSPLAEQWFLEIIVSVCKTYGINSPVKKSDILSTPMR